MRFQQNLADLFSPTLSKNYCTIFYVLAILQFILLALAVISFLFLFVDLKRNKYMIVPNLISIVTLTFLYFYNRLLYTMCDKAL